MYPPAFSSTLPTLHKPRGTNAAACPALRPYRVAPPRRPRPATSPHALFIWTSDFDDDTHDPDDEDLEDLTSSDYVDPSSSSSDSSSSSADDSSHRSTRRTDRPPGGGSYPSGTSPSSDDTWSFSFPTSFTPNSADKNILPKRHLYALLRDHTTGPDDVDGMRTLASECVSEAFARIVTVVLGSLPTDTFEVVVSCDRAGLSRLLQSALSTGYVLRNAEVRMLLNETMESSVTGMNPDDLQNALSQVDDQGHTIGWRGKVDVSDVSGKVRWWDRDREMKEEMNGSEYMAMLEAENELLRERLSASSRNESNGNKLLDFMTTLSPEKMLSFREELTEEAAETFKQVIKSVLGEICPRRVQANFSVGRDYVIQLVLWCLYAGYTVRNLEKRLEMSRMLNDTQAFAEPSSKDGDVLI